MTAEQFLAKVYNRKPPKRLYEVWPSNGKVRALRVKPWWSYAVIEGEPYRLAVLHGFNQGHSEFRTYYFTTKKAAAEWGIRWNQNSIDYCLKSIKLFKAYL